MYDLFVALILGVIEGITEFLPISSTGHLIVARAALNFEDYKNTFTVVIQIGAIAAVLWFFRHDLRQKIRGLYNRETEALNFWKYIAVGTIPAGVIGLAIESRQDILTTPTVVAWALIIGGVILWIVDRNSSLKQDGEVEKIEFKQISTKRAFLVGIGQSIAIIPGVSRSGATIVSGLAVGLNRPTATAYSFYLSIPVLVAASSLKLFRHGDSIHQISGGMPALIIGIVATFITALITISWLLRYVSRHNYRPFAYYRIGLGSLILLLLSFNVI